jgi:uncharacterized protein (DUF433 family)
MAQSEAEGRPIVRTESILGGDPRIEGTRIGVHHVVYPILEGEYSIEHVVTVTYPDLSEGDVLSALAHYIEHREEIEEMRKRRLEIIEKHCRDPDAITGPDDLPAELRPE